MASFKGKYKTHDKLTSDLVSKAEKLEKLLDTTGLHVTSGFRTPAENKAVGGWIGKSYHLSGRALDIGRGSFKENPQELYTKAKMAGFGGVIIYNTHVHVDTGPNYFNDKRSGNGKYDSNFVKVDLTKVNLADTINNIVTNSTKSDVNVDDLSDKQLNSYAKIGLAFAGVVALVSGLNN